MAPTSVSSVEIKDIKDPAHLKSTQLAFAEGVAIVAGTSLL